MLEIQQLTAGYPKNTVLQKISLTFQAGAVTVVAGPNGCGKSTLLKAIAGILPSSGQMLLDGEAICALPSRCRAQKIAFLPQNRQIPEITLFLLQKMSTLGTRILILFVLSLLLAMTIWTQCVRIQYHILFIKMGIAGQMQCSIVP